MRAIIYLSTSLVGDLSQGSALMEHFLEGIALENAKPLFKVLTEIFL